MIRATELDIVMLAITDLSIGFIFGFTFGLNYKRKRKAVK